MVMGYSNDLLTFYPALTASRPSLGKRARSKLSITRHSELLGHGATMFAQNLKQTCGRSKLHRRCGIRVVPKRRKVRSPDDGNQADTTQFVL